MATNNSINANSTTPLSKVNGGTGVNAVTTTPTATSFTGWDANSNLSSNAFIEGFATQATAGSTTVLTVSSKQIQEFTGTLNQTVTFPVTSTLVAGMYFDIINNSSGSLTLNSSGGNLILTMAANTSATVVCVLNSGTTAASWNSSYFFDNGAGVLSITGTANQVIASASTGAVTLSLPQSIATSSIPQFSGMTLLGTGVFNAMRMSTTSNDFVFIQGLNNTSTPKGAIVFGSNLFGSAVGNYVTFFNYTDGSFSFFNGAGGQVLDLLPAAATFSGQVIAPSFAPNTTAGIIGTTTNNNATAGSVGEYVESVVTTQAITNNTLTNVTSISLTAGDWDVWANIYTNPSSTQSGIAAGINTASATMPAGQFNTLTLTSTFASGIGSGISAPTRRLSLSTTTTVYLVAISAYSGSLTINGTLAARRRR